MLFSFRPILEFNAWELFVCLLNWPGLRSQFWHWVLGVQKRSAPLPEGVVHLNFFDTELISDSVRSLQTPVEGRGPHAGDCGRVAMLGFDLLYPMPKLIASDFGLLLANLGKGSVGVSDPLGMEFGFLVSPLAMSNKKNTPCLEGSIHNVYLSLSKNLIISLGQDDDLLYFFFNK